MVPPVWEGGDALLGVLEVFWRFGLFSIVQLEGLLKDSSRTALLVCDPGLSPVPGRERQIQLRCPRPAW